jgi:class 3 adenylate cyclase
MTWADPIRTSYSESRLEKLIAARRAPGADREAIDARIWDLFGERWAVMFTDLAGFSRHVADFGIIHFLQVIQESQRLLVPVIEDHAGILLKSDGDSLLVIFRSPARALRCALAMQRAAARYNRRRPRSEQVLLCVGLGHGDVLRIGDHDVWGTEVNAAAKLGEDAARPGDVLVTADLRDAVGDVRGVRFERIDVVPPGATGAFRAHAAARRPRRGA